jgi:hypothetical protein
MSLQTTRKENNWKTEETLAIAILTLDNGSKGRVLDIYDDDDNTLRHNSLYVYDSWRKN